ncbi:MAG TPA: hypothetical protein VFW02_05650 [Candidatus Limnocylindrales bacterium]|nr:hypothetical protein [Candidatus Limnocylindrales bacterium]
MTTTQAMRPDPIEPEAGDPPIDESPPGVRPLARRALLALGIAIGIAVVVCWLAPATGLILAWPFLFLVPGWVVVNRVVPHLRAPGRLGLAIVTSVYFSAHLVNLIARVDGFSRAPVLVSVVVLAVGSVILARVRHPWLAVPTSPSIAGIRASLIEDRAAWLVAGAIGGTVLAILGLNGWRQTADGIVSGGWNWSDLLVHVSIGSSIEHGNFPPEVPYFSGVPLTYHWFADFHGAIAATAAGVDIIPVYFLTSALFAAVLALLVWALALALTHRRRVATIAAILVCFGGGMGWFRLIGDLIAGGPSVVELITQGSYDNGWAGEWPFFRIASMLSTGFLPHRATTLGLPGLVAAILLVVTCLGRRPAGVLLGGILAALLAPFHFFAFPATYLVVLLYVAFSGGWRSPTVVRDAALFLAPVVAAIPFIAGAVVQQSDLGAFRPVLGWSEARFGDGPLAIAFFYLTNLGLPFVLALVAMLLGRDMPRRWFLIGWTAALFLVPNLVVVSAVEFDMNKYFQMMWIAVAILAAWLIQRWSTAVIVAVLAFSAISPALGGLWHLWSTGVVLTDPQLAAGRWIEQETPDRAIFVTDAWINSPIDLAGRRRISTFGPYAANLGYDPTQREADIKGIYCDGPDEAARLMARYGATDVLSSGGNPDCADATTDFAASPLFETIYDVDGVTVWHLRGS